MKLITSLVLFMGLPLAGCSRKEQATPAQPAPPLETSGNPITAPVDYLGAIAKAKKTAEKTVDTASLNRAVQLYYAQEGAYPKDLNELVAKRYLPSLPAPPYGTKLLYDAASGEVKIVPQ